jgi:hypothetical protein
VPEQAQVNLYAFQMWCELTAEAGNGLAHLTGDSAEQFELLEGVGIGLRVVGREPFGALQTGFQIGEITVLHCGKDPSGHPGWVSERAGFVHHWLH